MCVLTLSVSATDPSVVTCERDLLQLGLLIVGECVVFFCGSLQVPAVLVVAAVVTVAILGTGIVVVVVAVVCCLLSEQLARCVCSASAAAAAAEGAVGSWVEGGAQLLAV